MMRRSGRPDARAALALLASVVVLAALAAPAPARAGTVFRAQGDNDYFDF